MITTTALITVGAKFVVKRAARKLINGAALTSGEARGALKATDVLGDNDGIPEPSDAIDAASQIGSDFLDNAKHVGEFLIDIFA